MQDIANSLSSPAWWFSTVIAALLINLLSAYIKPSIDGWFSQLSARWRTRSDLRKSEIAREALQHALNPHLLRDSSERESRLRQQAIYTLLLALFLLFFPQLVDIQPSAIEPKTLSHFAVGTFLLLKALGFLLVMASLAFSNAADARETVVRLANRQLQTSHHANPAHVDSQRSHAAADDDA